MKRDLYARAGIPEYWVMNLQTSELVVFKNLTANEYRSEICLSSGTISPLAFPDLSIDLSYLLRLPCYRNPNHAYTTQFPRIQIAKINPKVINQIFQVVIISHPDFYLLSNLEISPLIMTETFGTICS